MTRLQKKCLVMSLCFHGVIMGAVVVTAAFRPEPALTGEPILTLIPLNARILDRTGVGGQPAAAAPRNTPTPTPTPPAPQPQSHAAPADTHPLPHQAEPPTTTRRTTPRATQDPPKVATTKSATETAPKKHEITPTYDPATPSSRSSSRNTATASASASRAELAAANNQRIRQQIESAIASLTSSLDSKDSSSKVVPLPGLDGGEAFIGYRTAIFNAYYHAWNTPEATTHRTAVADVKIVVSRDGEIISSEFVSKSGDGAIDRSVQRALDAVKHLPPFPTVATDTERTFIIRFNLEAKESAG